MPRRPWTRRRTCPAATSESVAAVLVGHEAEADHPRLRRPTRTDGSRADNANGLACAQRLRLMARGLYHA